MSLLGDANPMPLISKEEDCFLRGRLRRSTVKTNLDVSAGAACDAVTTVSIRFPILRRLGSFHAQPNPGKE